MALLLRNSQPRESEGMAGWRPGTSEPQAGESGHVPDVRTPQDAKGSGKFGMATLERHNEEDAWGMKTKNPPRLHRLRLRSHVGERTGFARSGPQSDAVPETAMWPSAPLTKTVFGSAREQTAARSVVGPQPEKHGGFWPTHGQRDTDNETAGGRPDTGRV